MRDVKQEDNMRIRRFAALSSAIVIAMSLLLSGCGGDTSSVSDAGTSAPVSTTEPADSTPEASEPEGNSMTALEVSRLMGNGINLGNTLEAYNHQGYLNGYDPAFMETGWGQPTTTPEMIKGMKDAGFDVISVGKISDIFVEEGITESHRSKTSVHGMEQTIEIADMDFTGLCFVNLVDFDTNWGHRRNPIGYGEEIERFDVKLGELTEKLGEDDLLILTADHGNDPTHVGTDHTRENVFLIAYSPSMDKGGMIGEADTFAVLGASITDNFGVQMPEGTIGYSVLDKLI